jgi:tRNA-Thr(GGU) m(6)t(6)A37 methyltransferase TsaA
MAFRSFLLHFIGCSVVFVLLPAIAEGFCNDKPPPLSNTSSTDTRRGGSSSKKKKDVNVYKNYASQIKTPQEVTLQTIAVIRSPYTERFGTPRQAPVEIQTYGGKAMDASIVFLPRSPDEKQRYAQALSDLDGFDRIWVISYMHLNADSGWKPKVVPPRGPQGVKRGLFATRSPHRPNSIALSALRVTSISAADCTIHVNGIDLIDGTPVLDIKPYIGFADSFPDSRCGWLDAFGDEQLGPDRYDGNPPTFIGP